MMTDKLLIVISGPSGAGKGTLCKALLERNKAMTCAVSATSRECRPGETPDVTYHYIGERAFLKGIEAGNFLEYAQVYGNYYGTLKEEVFRGFNKGCDVILEIDIQGALQIKNTYKRAVCIFVMPPSFKELRNRICKRNRDSEEDIEKRMEEVTRELSYVSEYDYIVVNDYVEEAVKKMEAIVKAEKCRLERCFIDVEAFIKE